MKLIITNNTLKALHDRLDDDISYAVKDIMPKYQIGDPGYIYRNISNNDADYIYSCIKYLKSWFRDPIFNDWSYYVTEKNAIRQLDHDVEDIKVRYEKLIAIKSKYVNMDANIYPIDVCISYYQYIVNILADIYNSEELIVFRKPNIFKENRELKFEIWWKKRLFKLIIHLLSFILFLGIFITILLLKSSGNEAIYIIIPIGIVTILFNLLFNNHQSFKDSWKIILSSTRKSLKERYYDNTKMWENI